MAHLQSSVEESQLLGQLDMDGLQISTPEHEDDIQRAADIIACCSSLLAELEEFKVFLNVHGNGKLVDVRRFQQDLEAEIKRTKKLPTDDPKKRAQYLNCSNVPFLEALWTTAKGSSGVKTLVSIGRRNKVPVELSRQCQKAFMDVHTSTKSEDVASSVDILANNGLEWVKVSTITERKMLFDLAKSGWVDGDTSDDEDDFEPDGLFKVASGLVRMARRVKVKYQNPSVRLVLPRITRNRCHAEIVKILEKIEALGVTVQTAENIACPLPISEVLSIMAPNPFYDFSETLNVDTTLLLAFASDLSHDTVKPEDWHHRMISHQIKMEQEDQMLPSSLWPACGSRKLVCTREAAERTLEIVRTLATEIERKRTALLLGSSEETSRLSRAERIQEMQKLSKYKIPLDWQLPVQIIDFNIVKIKSSLPPVAEKVSGVLRGINTSIFFFGWWSGYTTISSNKTVAKEIEKAIEANQTEDVAGPNIWLAPASRSLVGNEKERRGNIPEERE